VSSPVIIGIVDDDPDVRGSLDSLLRSVGLVPRCFGSAEALLAGDARDGIACIVTDLHMPGMTGLELQAEARRRGWSQPVIMMTAFPTDATRAEALAGGAVAFLTKPIDPDALLDAVDAAIGREAL
jgi:FixJ family two-component response regulator